MDAHDDYVLELQIDDNSSNLSEASMTCLAGLLLGALLVWVAAEGIYS